MISIDGKFENLRRNIAEENRNLPSVSLNFSVSSREKL